MTELETKLRELSLWDKFKKALIKEEGLSGFLKQQKGGFYGGLSNQIMFDQTEEGHEFWYNIKKNHKI